MTLGIIPGGVACATAHRPQHLPPDVHAWCATALIRVAQRLSLHHGVTRARCGMAVGGDMWWGEAALAAGMLLHADIPFAQQPDRWPASSRRLWADLRQRATSETVYGDLGNLVDPARKRRATQLLHERNDGMLFRGPHLVGVVVALWDPAKVTGGTASAVRKAQARGLPIIHINPAARTVGMLGGAR